MWKSVKELGAVMQDGTCVLLTLVNYNSVANERLTYRFYNSENLYMVHWKHDRVTWHGITFVYNWTDMVAVSCIEVYQLQLYL